METLQIGIIGLGRMGGNMARRLLRAGHQCVGFDYSAGNVETLVGDGGGGASSLEDLVQKLSPPRAIWLMVPAGNPTEQTVLKLAELLAPNDTIIDGGNSNFHDDVRRAKMLAEKGIQYMDVGTSGGVWGLERGYCLMIGGPEEAFKRLEPIFKTLAPGPSGIPPTSEVTANTTAAEGYLLCGRSGSGHYVKMVHNGIEYGLMQAYAEGFDIIKNATCKDLPENTRYDIDLRGVAEVWRRGSVITSWLLDLSSRAFNEDVELSGFTGNVADSGEGRWTIQAALDQGVPAEVLTAALYTRFRSRQIHTYAEKVLSAMRKGFGGHVEKPPIVPPKPAEKKSA
jgi:6-phosphogluconate dehydrogenase